MKHKIFHIVAASGDVMAGEGVIGRNNSLPWPKYQADLKFFKETTMGHTIIMGRKTFESIGRPLSGRENIVVSHSKLDIPNIKCASSIKDAIKQASHTEVFIVGGAEIYLQTLPAASGIFLTQVPGNYPGDTKYPPIPPEFVPNEEESNKLKAKFGIQITYLENTVVPRPSNG